jgi:hypothetical protein
VNRIIRKTAVLSASAACSLLEVYRRFRVACYLHQQGPSRRFENVVLRRPKVLHRDAYRPDALCRLSSVVSHRVSTSDFALFVVVCLCLEEYRPNPRNQFPVSQLTSFRGPSSIYFEPCRHRDCTCVATLSYGLWRTLVRHPDDWLCFVRTFVSTPLPQASRCSASLRQRRVVWHPVVSLPFIRNVVSVLCSRRPIVWLPSGWVELDQVWLGEDRLGYIRLGLVRVDSVKIG